MRRVINGSGVDNTVAAQAYLLSNNRYLIKDLYLIGEPDDPRALWLTEHEAPVLYQPWGTFQPAVISRGQVTAKIGLDSQTLQVTWSPGKRASTVNTATASPYQLAQLHFYDNWPVRIWRAIMPTPGDANSIGCIEWFAGRVSTAAPSRNKIVFSVPDYMNVLKQKVPSTVIELTNVMAATAASTLPPGDPSIPIFQCFTGSTETGIIADCTSPTAGKIYSGNLFAGGYMVFLSGPGATLAGCWSAIGQNGAFTDGSGNHHSEFTLYAALPWPPTPTVDTFYVSKTAPIDSADPASFGFPYVPNPQTAV
jgi:hypothetical protein